jgi:deoxycytidine triphosphate deaminase
MILGTDKVKKLIDEDNLIEDLCERELNNPESIVIDLRLNKLFKLKGKGFLGIDERQTPEAEEIISYHPGEKRSYTIKPGEYLIAESIEKVNVPKNVFVLFKPRTTLHRMGIIMRGTVADPGFGGILHPAIYNAGPCEVEIELGARFFQCIFVKIDGESVSYRGQWQGGRVFTEEKEKQV